MELFRKAKDKENAVTITVRAGNYIKNSFSYTEKHNPSLFGHILSVNENASSEAATKGQGKENVCNKTVSRCRKKTCSRA